MTQFTALDQLQIACQHLHKQDTTKYIEKVKDIQLYCDELILKLQQLPGKERTIKDQELWIQQLQDQLDITKEE